jgi:predicted Abi (CAAX) family protease
MDIRRTTGRVESGLVTLQSYKTALPRNAFNLFLSSMLESGSNLVLMDNVQIGGFWTPEQKQHTFNPTPATTIVDVVKHMMAQGQQIPPNLTNEQFIQFVLEKEGVKSLEELAQKYSQK